MNAGQYEGLLHALGEIRDRLPVVPARVTVRTPVVVPAAQEPVRNLTGSALAVGGRRALEAMLGVAEGWAETASENDEAMGRRDLKTPKDQPFVLDDIRRMVEDAAREIGLTGPVRKETNA